MILFPLQEAELLDRYSVLLIKQAHGLNVALEMSSFMNSVGDRLNNAMASSEFVTLSEINKEIFDLVEKARRDECRASAVASANDARYLAKAALQKKWFGAPLVESKTGLSNE